MVAEPAPDRRGLADGGLGLLEAPDVGERLAGKVATAARSLPGSGSSASAAPMWVTACSRSPRANATR